MLMVFFNSSGIAWGNDIAKTWNASSFKQKVKIFSAFYQFFQESKFEIAAHNDWPSFISKAYAQDGMNCIYAGWPSQLYGGVCARPSKTNSQYDSGACSNEQLNCNPLLFGPGLCAPQKTKNQRIRSFSNCSKQAKEKGLSAKDIVKGILDSNLEQDLVKLFEFAERICANGKQKGTGMCSLLKKNIDEIKQELKDRKAAETANAAFSAVEKIGIPKSGKCAQVQLETSPPLAISTYHEQELSPALKMETQKRLIETAPVEALLATPNRNPAKLPSHTEQLSTPANHAFVPTTRPSYPIRRYIELDGAQFGVDTTDEGLVVGFHFDNKSQNNINPRTAPYGSKRQWSFVFDQRSAQDAKIRITEDSGLTGKMSHDLLETGLVFLPRKTVPTGAAAMYNGALAKKITLPTGEIVYFDNKSNEILGGALSEEQMDMASSRHHRRFAQVNYHGKGIMIRTDRRAGTPEHIYSQSYNVNENTTEAAISHQGKTCHIPKSEIWAAADDQNSNTYFKYADDSEFLSKVINPLCGWDLGLEDLQ